jgi:DNA-binding MarR family transcriptional regulator
MNLKTIVQGGDPLERAQQIAEIIRLYRQVNRYMRQDSPDVWMDLTLTIPQLKSLFFIANEGTTNFRKLATALKVTPSNVTGIVDRLFQQGLVTRQENPEDRRVSLLKATEHGEAIVDNLRERRATYLSRVLSKLGAEELSNLKKGLAAMVRAAGDTGGKK